MAAFSDPAAGARLSAIAGSSTDAILAKDTQGIITAWNPAAERLYGFTAAEIIGRSVAEIIPPDRVGEDVEILEKVLRGEVITHYDTARLHKDRHRVAVSITVSAIRDAAGVIVGASTIARDIGDRLRAEADRAFFSTLVHQSPDAIIALDRANIITSWNPAAERIYGYSTAEAVGRHGADLMEADAAGATDPAVVLKDVFAGETLHLEVRRRHANGRALLLSISVSPLRDSLGDVYGAISTVRDITAAQAAEEEIERAAERETRLQRELDQARRLESIGQLAGGVAHDFNNLLGIVLNYTTFVADTLPAGSAALEDLEQIRRAAERGAALTRQLLIFSRREVVKREAVDLNELITGLQPLLHRALGERLAVEIELDPGLPPIEADRGQLEQVLISAPLA